MNAKKVGLAGALIAFLASSAGAQTLTVEKARAIVTPFYEALNRSPEKDVAKLLEQATSSDWMSCGGNDACFPREKIIGGFKSLTRNWWFSCASEAAGDKLDAGNHEPGESAFK